MKNKNLSNRTEKNYIIMYFACMIWILLYIVITHGSAISELLFNDIRDTGMDFFHSIEYVRGRTPYRKFNTLYPPLANLLFLLLYRCVPTDISTLWSDNFDKSILMRGTDTDLRTYQAPMVLFLAFTIIVILCTIILFYKLLKRRLPDKIAIPLSCAIFMSWGTLFGIERGNIIIGIPALLTIFLLYYDSNNPLLREISLICLEISDGLKIYPALLGIYLIKDKNKIGYAPILRTVIYGILAIILPCIAFHEGIGAIPLWLKSVAEFQTKDNTIVWAGIGLNNVAITAVKIIEKTLNVALSVSYINIVKYIIVISLLIISYIQPKKWLSIMSCVLAMIWYQTQSEYILCMYSLPILFYFKEEQNSNRTETIIFILLSLLTLPCIIPRNFIFKNFRYLFIQAVMILQYLGLIYICFNSIHTKRNSSV